METDVLGVGFDFYWTPPPGFLLDAHDLDLAGFDSFSMHVPAAMAETVADSTSGLYTCREGSNSPDGANSYTAAVPPPLLGGGAGDVASNKNMVMERDRRRRMNEKLYALRSVVPNITKMDKASIIRDAIAYIEKLQEDERRMVAEISGLESSCSTTAAVKRKDAGRHAADGADSFPWRKKLRRTPPGDDGACTRTQTASSQPVQILEVQVSDVGEKVAVVSVRCSRGRDAVSRVCRALEPLRLRVVTASVAAVGDTVVHTMFVQTTEEIDGAQLKKTVQAALSNIDVMGRFLKPIRF